jgi:sialate O-acetylesterase
MRRLLLLIMCFAAVLTALADVQPNAMFTDHMVLQRDVKVPVWGTAEPGEAITVSFKGQVKETVAGDDGTWQVKLDALEADSEPSELIIRGENEVCLTDVLVGEVWFCSGQSNMAFALATAKNADQDIAAATNFPTIRLYKVERKTNPKNFETSAGSEWERYNERSCKQFSAVASYFGRSINSHLKIPVGLIQSAWGGTPAQSWTRREALERLPFMKDALERSDKAQADYTPEGAQQAFDKQMAEWQAKKDAGQTPGRKPRLWNPWTSPWEMSSLYNGMVAPVVPYAIRGVIWYQGEANAGWHQVYHELFSAMITDWRGQWGQGDFPFLFVQLANFMKVQENPVDPDTSTWPFLRESQEDTLALPNTGMAVITDVGEANDIHPKDKKTVGERLALAARAKAYGEDLVYSGPLFQTLEIKDSKAVVHFDHVGGGLVARGTVPEGFAISGADGVWHWADAYIVGDTVELSSPEVVDPIAVRYNWANNPIGNLYNKEGLPASLFRSDR